MCLLSKYLHVNILFLQENNSYGGCEGPNAMYVKLISSDGHEFIVKREHALTSGTIKAMLSGPGQFAENETNEVNFREIPYVQNVLTFSQMCIDKLCFFLFSGLMYCRRFACISLTRCDTPTARLRFPSSQLLPRSPWSC